MAKIQLTYTQRDPFNVFYFTRHFLLRVLFRNILNIGILKFCNLSILSDLSYMVLFGAEASLKALEYCILRERSG